MTTTRHSSQSRDTLAYVPSAPIPIPHMRRVTDPPPRSPTRYEPSSDLIFEMSPHVAHETPLSQHRDPLIAHNADAYCMQQSTLPPFASRFGYAKSPPGVNPPPYWEEPFLYSIPRLSPRSPLHSRTQSAVVKGSCPVDHQGFVKKDHSVAYPSSFSVKSFYSVESRFALGSDISHSDNEADGVLTTAFQQSFTSTSSSQSSTSSEQAPYGQPISPPASFRDEKCGADPIRVPRARNKRSSIQCTAVPASIRTSAAEPVVSFAQAEVEHSPSCGMIARVVRNSKDSIKSSLRARSPYPLVRGRRNSILRNRSLKVSDEDIAGTLEKSDLDEKPGLERFFPTAFLRRGAADENQAIEQMMPERGRTRSRTRTGRRL